MIITDIQEKEDKIFSWRIFKLELIAKLKIRWNDLKLISTLFLKLKLIIELLNKYKIVCMRLGFS